jgi:hypothetical protein
MSKSSNDPTPPESESSAPEQPIGETTPKPDGRQTAPLAAKALPYLAALAAATASPTGAATPPANADRTYLEALLRGSWTEPPDLTARRLPAANAESEGYRIAADWFNDSGGSGPYTDERFVDSGFGDHFDDH